MLPYEVVPRKDDKGNEYQAYKVDIDGATLYVDKELVDLKIVDINEEIAIFKKARAA